MLTKLKKYHKHAYEVYYKGIKELQNMIPTKYTMSVENCEQRMLGFGYEFEEVGVNTWKLKKVKRTKK